MKLDLKEWIAKVTNTITKPCIEAVAFNAPVTSKTTGAKTASATISVPSGYEVIPNCRPVSVYISGDVRVSVTDRSNVTMNGSTATFSYYLYNPQGVTSNLAIACTILCRRVGG